MNKSLYILSSLCLLATSPLVSCGGSERTLPSSAGQGGISMLVLEGEVSHEAGDRAQALVGESWQSLGVAPGAVTALKAGPRGSVVRIGEATLWLRSGSHVRVGQDLQGSLMIDIKSGQARVQSNESGMLLLGEGSESFAGRDLLVSHDDQRTRVIETRMQPRRADWSLELEEEAATQGIGSLEVASEDDDPATLELRKLHVAVRVSGGMAITEVEHVFYNDSDEQMEGTFRFPAPDGVMVTGLAMEIGGTLMEGEFVERRLARQIYEKIVDEMQDPALLEWQQGGWFKLRVFPIEAKSEKRVVLRYAAPLQTSVGGYEYRYLATPPEQTSVGQFQLSLDGKVVSRDQDLRRSKDVVLAFPESAVPAVVGEERADYSYRVATIRPDWKSAPTIVGDTAPRQVVLALDSSRSALENRELSLEVLEMVLAELSPQDQFAVFAHDISPREAQHGLVAASAENIQEAIAFYRSLELDGASDLGATLRYAGSLLPKTPAKGASTQVIYVGDGTPSWGAVTEENLRAASGAIGDAPLFAAILGRGASQELWTNLCGGTGGTVVRPHTKLESRKLAFFLARAPGLTRMNKVSFVADEGVEIFPSEPRTLFEGERMTVVLRAPKGSVPAQLTMQSTVDGRAISQSIDLGYPGASAAPDSLVAKRWASREIARLQRTQADKQDIVEMSREFGVLSKHTSLLVLESEEAYEQHQIERRNAEAQRLLARNDAPQVTGGDLDNLDAREASLSPDHIQPGDPEVRIPAPADARSVVLVFPFGDTKVAHYDEDTDSWVARFLVDPDTEDGRYWVRVTIEHANGRLEDLRLPYTVDTTPPDVSLRVVQLSGNRYRVVVEQEGGDDASAQQLDASRVEIQFPWGDTERLYRKRLGLFRKIVQAPAPLGESVTLRLVVTDEALNQRVLTLDVPVVGGSVVGR